MADGSDGLHWWIGSNSQVQVNLGGTGQVYSPSDRPTSGRLYNSVFLRVDRGTDATTRIYHDSDTGSSIGLRFTQVSQSAVSGDCSLATPCAVTTVLKPSDAQDSGITLTITDEYIRPQLWLKRRLALSGLPASGAAVKIYQNIDTYLQGNDKGPGLVRTSSGNTSGVPDLVGVIRNSQFEALRHQPSSGTPLWNRYFTGDYTLPHNQICDGTDNSRGCKTGTGDLSNQVDTSTSTDNGMAVQWNVPAGATRFEVEYLITFTQTPVDLGKAFSPASIAPNGVSTLTFSISNRSTSPLTDIDFTDNLPAGMKVAPVPNVRTSCPAGGALASSLPAGMTVSAAAGATSIAVSKVPVNQAAGAGAEQKCEVAVDVTASTPGSYTNGPTNMAGLRNIANFVSNQTLQVTGTPIAAANDTGNTPATGGTAVPNVLANDTFNGAPATTANVTLTQVSASNPGLTLDPATGAVNVAPGTPAGTHTLTYRICDKATGTPCTTATVTVTVGTAPIQARPDTTRIAPGATGVVVPNVLGNDSVQGSPAQLGTLVLSQVNTSNPALQLNTATGAVSLTAPLPAGSYSLTYQICQVGSPGTCSTATVTVIVGGGVGGGVTGVPTNSPLGLLALTGLLAWLGARRRRG